MRKTPEEKKQFDKLAAQIAQLFDQKLALEAELDAERVRGSDVAIAAAKLLSVIHKMTHRFTYQEFNAITEDVEAEFVARDREKEEKMRETPIPCTKKKTQKKRSSSPSVDADGLLKTNPPQTSDT